MSFIVVGKMGPEILAVTVIVSELGSEKVTLIMLVGSSISVS